MFHDASFHNYIGWYVKFTTSRCKIIEKWIYYLVLVSNISKKASRLQTACRLWRRRRPFLAGSVHIAYAETICQLRSTSAETVVVVAICWALLQPVLFRLHHRRPLGCWRRRGEWWPEMSSWREHKANTVVVKATATTTTAATTTTTRHAAVPLTHANQLPLSWL